MGLHYQNFSQLRKKKEEPKEPLKKVSLKVKEEKEE